MLQLLEDAGYTFIALTLKSILAWPGLVAPEMGQIERNCVFMLN